MQKFLAELRTQRWDDHRYYHHSRINQSLHFLSAISFLVAYVMMFKDPVVAALSQEMIELWDDCMSFPDLLVRVRRHACFTMTYHDENWREHQLRIDGVLSELLQHEIDHLDGVLAVSRAIDGASFALQSQRHLLAGAVFANEPRCQFFPAA